MIPIGFLSGFQDALLSPISQGILSLLASQQDQANIDAANAANLRRENEIRGIFGREQASLERTLPGIRQETISGLDALFGGRQGQIGDFLGTAGGRFQGTGNQIAQLGGMLTNAFQRRGEQLSAQGIQGQRGVGRAFEDRLRTLNRDEANVINEAEALRGRTMGRLDELGSQQREDINERFDRRQSELAGNLQRRGLTGSTILPSLRSEVEEGRSDSLGRFEERLTQLRAGADERLTGGINAARQQFAQGRLGAGGDLALANERGLGRQSNLDVLLSGNTLGQAGLTNNQLFANNAQARDFLNQFQAGADSNLFNQQLAAFGGLQDSARNDQLTLSQIPLQTAAFIERISDIPDTNSLAPLVQQFSRAAESRRLAQALKPPSFGEQLLGGVASGLSGGISGLLTGGLSSGLGALGGLGGGFASMPGFGFRPF